MSLLVSTSYYQVFIYAASRLYKFLSSSYKVFIYAASRLYKFLSSINICRFAALQVLIKYIIKYLYMPLLVSTSSYQVINHHLWSHYLLINYYFYFIFFYIIKNNLLKYYLIYINKGDIYYLCRFLFLQVLIKYLSSIYICRFAAFQVLIKFL